MAEIKELVFGAEDLQRSLDEIRLVLNLPDGPNTVEELAHFRSFKLFDESGPYVRMIKLARSFSVDLWNGIGTDQDLPAMVNDKTSAEDKSKAELRATLMKIVKRWTMTKVWEQHPPEQSYKIHFLCDDVLNQRMSPKTVKVPRKNKTGE